MITAEVIQSRHSDLFTFIQGRLDSRASRCDPPEEASSLSLAFVSTLQQLKQAYLHEPAIVVLESKIADSLVFDANAKSCYFSVKSVPMAMATLLPYFDHKSERFTQWGIRHSTALVHERAHVGKDVVLGPFCVIGANATIADGCLIGAHTIIENDAKIGEHTVIHAHVFVGAACVIGSACEIHPNTTIGSDGFGYAVDSDGRPKKISHLGNVVIGDCVEIGSGCAVDRATLTSTRIRSGTKIDNLCHIAHNCDLGENGFYTAGFMMGGSTTIGRQFATGGGSVVTAHVTLGDNVVLAGRSTVTHDVPKAGAYGGYPLQSLPEALKTVASMGQLNEIRKNLNRVIKHLKLDEPREVLVDTSKGR